MSITIACPHCDEETEISETRYREANGRWVMCKGCIKSFKLSEDCIVLTLDDATPEPVSEVWHTMICPHCHHQMKLRSELTNTVYRCPHCRGSIAVKGSGEAEESFSFSRVAKIGGLSALAVTGIPGSLFLMWTLFPSTTAIMKKSQPTTSSVAVHRAAYRGQTKVAPVRNKMPARQTTAVSNVRPSRRSFGAGFNPGMSPDEIAHILEGTWVEKFNNYGKFSTTSFKYEPQGTVPLYKGQFTGTVSSQLGDGETQNFFWAMADGYGLGIGLFSYDEGDRSYNFMVKKWWAEGPHKGKFVGTDSYSLKSENVCLKTSNHSPLFGDVTYYMEGSDLHIMRKQ